MFRPTDSGDADGCSQRFEAAFAGRAETSVLSLFCHDPWGYAEPKMLSRTGRPPGGRGLGFVRASACPHYLGEPGRREKCQGWVADGSLADGLAADDYTALLFRDGQFVEAIAERPDWPVFR